MCSEKVFLITSDTLFVNKFNLLYDCIVEVFIECSLNQFEWNSLCKNSFCNYSQSLIRYCFYIKLCKRFSFISLYFPDNESLVIERQYFALLKRVTYLQLVMCLSSYSSKNIDCFLRNEGFSEH